MVSICSHWSVMKGSFIRSLNGGEKGRGGERCRRGVVQRGEWMEINKRLDFLLAHSYSYSIENKRPRQGSTTEADCPDGFHTSPYFLPPKINEAPDTESSTRFDHLQCYWRRPLHVFWSIYSPPLWFHVSFEGDSSMEAFYRLHWDWNVTSLNVFHFLLITGATF